jgi:hypothetical protein
MGGCRDEVEMKTAIVSKVRDHLRASEPAIASSTLSSGIKGDIQGVD